MASPLPDITSTQSTVDVPSTSNDEQHGPDIEWEDINVDLKQIASNDRLPCIGYFQEDMTKEDDGQYQRLSPGLKIYSHQTILFHMAMKKKQVRARSIYREKNGAYYEIGQTLIIPDDYVGWFEIVPSDFSRSACFRSIEELAKANPRRFFTRSNIKGIRVETEAEKSQKFMERKIPAGSVLHTNGQFKAKWKTRANTGLFKKKTTEWELQEITYLKCIDTDGIEIMVPFTHEGKFNAIFENGEISQNAVYTIKDILDNLSLPVRVRLLYGKAPVVPCIFTGMLVLRNIIKDEVLVGSTILNKRNVLFEIPLNSMVKANTTSNDEDVKELSTYHDAKKLCRKYSHLFSSMIKLSPELDTSQKVIQHVPSDPHVMQDSDEKLKALDLITDISLSNEPRDQFMDSSDGGSSSIGDQPVFPEGGVFTEMTEYKSSESHTNV